MPAYEYKCKNCETVVVLVRSFSDSSIPDCEVCNEPMQKNFNVGGVYIH